MAEAGLHPDWTYTAPFFEQGSDLGRCDTYVFVFILTGAPGKPAGPGGPGSPLSP